MIKIGQSEILMILENSNVPLSSKEIADLLKENHVKICCLLKKLIKHNEVKTIDLNKILAMKFFKSKRRLQLFYA